MPKYVCGKCQQELWGWGVDYQQRAGHRIVCPDCCGDLILQNEETSHRQDTAISEETTAA